MTTEKTKLINTIADRIKTEREKHPFIDREIFAAQKIYDTLITFWQEKTRWKSLIKEPPHHYPKSYFLRMGLNGEPRSMPFLSKNSTEEYIDYGFTHWKEIE